MRKSKLFGMIWRFLARNGHERADQDALYLGYTEFTNLRLEAKELGLDG